MWSTPRAFRICRQDQPRRSNSVATVFSAVFFVSRASIAGLLSGFAADEVMDHEAEQVVLVDDVRRKVFGAAPAMRLGDIRVGLAALRPGLYEDLDNTGISALLRASGVQVDTVYVADKPREETSRKGVKREWLDVSTTETIGDEVLPEGGSADLDSVVYLGEAQSRVSGRSR